MRSQAELGISEEFEQYDDEREFRRLIRAVRFSQKHYLYFVCCNQVPKQNELIEKTKKILKGKKIKVIKFKKPITDLLTELQKETFSKECEAVFVQGLEYSISSDGKGDENALIHNLNISRDTFKKYLSCPLFLWLPEYAIVKIIRHASDFFSVRSGTFYFSSTPERVTEQIFQSFSSSWVETSSLPLTEKLKKIETLQSLLAEYQGLHKDRRNEQTESRLLTNLADFFYSISEYRKAIEYREQALEISRQIADRQAEGNSLGNLGRAYHYLGDYQKAIEYQERHLEISRQIADRQAEGISLGSLGVVYHNLGDYQKAIEYQEQSLQIKREIGNRLGEGNSLGNLGLAYNNLGDYQKAIEYQKQYLAISREIGNRLGEGISLGNLGLVYDNLGDYRKAIEYHKQHLTISREIGDRLGEGLSLSNLGNAHKNLGENEKACHLWKESLAIFEAIESPHANRVRQLFKEYCES